MKRKTLLSLVFSGVSLCMQPALAQAPGGGVRGQSPSTPPTLPGQSPSGQPGLNGPNTDTMSAKVDDKKFAKEAVLGGMVEVELGKLASEKASRDDIKQFGQQMVAEHTKANDLLKKVASKENIPIPDALDSKHQSRVDKLAKLSGEDFDKAYMKDELKDHQAAVRDFSAEAQNGADPNIKAFASNVLPALQEHLELAKNLNKSKK